MSQHTGKQPEVGHHSLILNGHFLKMIFSRVILVEEYSSSQRAESPARLILGWTIICNIMFDITFVTGEQQIPQPIEGLRPATHIRGKVGPEGSRL